VAVGANTLTYGAQAETLVASHLLKAVEGSTDLGFGDCELRYVRDKQKREVDFLVVRDRKPQFLVEVKMSGMNLSPTLARFQAQTKAVRAFQVVMNLLFEPTDCFGATRPVSAKAAVRGDAGGDTNASHSREKFDKVCPHKRLASGDENIADSDPMRLWKRLDVLLNLEELGGGVVVAPVVPTQSVDLGSNVLYALISGGMVAEEVRAPALRLELLEEPRRILRIVLPEEYLRASVQESCILKRRFALQFVTGEVHGSKFT